jgi:hypothetical protein
MERIGSVKRKDVPTVLSSTAISFTNRARHRSVCLRCGGIDRRRVIGRLDKTPNSNIRTYRRFNARSIVPDRQAAIRQGRVDSRR